MKSDSSEDMLEASSGGNRHRERGAGEQCWDQGVTQETAHRGSLLHPAPDLTEVILTFYTRLTTEKKLVLGGEKPSRHCQRLE